jgi:hypothetical protein
MANKKQRSCNQKTKQAAAYSHSLLKYLLSYFLFATILGAGDDAYQVFAKMPATIHKRVYFVQKIQIAKIRHHSYHPIVIKSLYAHCKAKQNKIQPII